MEKDLEKFKQYSKEIIKISGWIYLKEIIFNTLRSQTIKFLYFYEL